MKTERGYRFTVSFTNNSAEKIRVGEFLESCGNKKGAVIVEAITAYLDTNPELPVITGAGSPVQVLVKQTLTREEVESIVRDAIKGMGGIPAAASPAGQAPAPEEASADDVFVSKMMDNFSELFD